MLGKHRFHVGQRVRPSPEGKAANIFIRKHLDASGVVTAVDEWNSPTVRWDHRKTADSYASHFIEPDLRPRAKPSEGSAG